MFTFQRKIYTSVNVFFENFEDRPFLGRAEAPQYTSSHKGETDPTKFTHPDNLNTNPDSQKADNTESKAYTPTVLPDSYRESVIEGSKIDIQSALALMPNDRNNLWPPISIESHAERGIEGKNVESGKITA